MASVVSGGMSYQVFLKVVCLALCFLFYILMICGLDLKISLLLMLMMLLF